jgi:predicted small secreted protein
MKRNHGTCIGIAVLLLAAMFTLAGCDTGNGGGDGNGGGGGLSQAEKEAAKTAALEDYAGDPAGFADFVAGMNSLKGWNLPPNPNNWSASQWEQYYSFIAEYQNENGNGNGNGEGFTAGWPPSSVLTQFGISGMTQPAGATNVEYTVETRGGYGLGINFYVSSANDSPINTVFTNNSWTKNEGSSWDDETGLYWVYEKTGFEEAFYSRSASTGACVIYVLKELN